MTDHEEANPKDFSIHRRNLILASTVTLILLYTSIDLTKITFLGIELENVSAAKLHVLVLVWLGYALIRYSHSLSLVYDEEISNDIAGIMPRIALRILRNAAKDAYNNRPDKEERDETSWVFLSLSSVRFDHGPGIPQRRQVTCTVQARDVKRDAWGGRGVTFTVNRWHYFLIRLGAFNRAVIFRHSFVEYGFPAILALGTLTWAFVKWFPW